MEDDPLIDVLNSLKSVETREPFGEESYSAFFSRPAAVDWRGSDLSYDRWPEIESTPHMHSLGECAASPGSGRLPNITQRNTVTSKTSRSRQRTAL